MTDVPVVARVRTAADRAAAARAIAIARLGTPPRAGDEDNDSDVEQPTRRRPRSETAAADAPMKLKKANRAELRRLMLWCGA